MKCLTSDKISTSSASASILSGCISLKGTTKLNQVELMNVGPLAASRARPNPAMV